MSIEDNIFKKFTPDYKKLTAYGFKRNKNVYQFKKNFYDNEFKAIIEMTKEGIISGKVYDIENNDEFLPMKIESEQGAFVGEIRKEYTDILTDIRDNCFSENYFLFPQSNRITHAIINKYGDKPDFMWDKFPEYGVFKNPESSKWYGLISNINYSKLGKTDNKLVEILNLKLDKDKIQELLKRDGFYPAWHMNKKSWITVTLDETIPDDEILKLVDESHSYTVKPSKN